MLLVIRLILDAIIIVVFLVDGDVIMILTVKIIQMKKIVRLEIVPIVKYNVIAVKDVYQENSGEETFRYFFFFEKI